MSISILKNKIQRTTVSISSLFIIWFILAQQYSSVILPGPSVVLQQLKTLLFEASFWHAICSTITLFLVSLACSFLLGCTLGICAGLSTVVYDFISPIVSIAQAIPPISWILFAILWLGESGGAQLFIVTITLTPIFFFNSLKGIHLTSKDLLEMATCFQVSKYKIFRDIYLAAVVPFIQTALLITVGMGWKTIIMSELIIGQGGIGQEIGHARNFFDTPKVFAWTVIIAVTGVMMEAMIRKIISGRNIHDTH